MHRRGAVQELPHEPARLILGERGAAALAHDLRQGRPDVVHHEERAGGVAVRDAQLDEEWVGAARL